MSADSWRLVSDAFLVVGRSVVSRRSGGFDPSHHLESMLVENGGAFLLTWGNSFHRLFIHVVSTSD